MAEPEPDRSEDEWKQHHDELGDAIKAVHAKLAQDTMDGFIELVIAQERINRAEAGEREEVDPEELQARYDRLQKQAVLKQTALSKITFVMFLAFRAITNKIFSFFLCYQTGDRDYTVMYDDYSRSCNEEIYEVHIFVCTVLMVAIPLGVPFGMGKLLFGHRHAILKHEGPHEFEALYTKYKSSYYMWDIWQMNQKVTLIGLLSFIDRGSILQSLLGLVVSAIVLCMMLSAKPYVQARTNIFAIAGQLMIVIAYLAAVLLRATPCGS